MASSLSKIFEHKSKIDATLLEFLASKKSSLLNQTPLATSVLEKIQSFITRGKSVRGCLSVFSYYLASEKPSANIYILAAGLELFQGAFLIHDDIMDRDEMRRGVPSVYAQFAKDAKTSDEGLHYGVSQAINMGDLCFFWGMELIARSTPNAELLLYVTKQLATVVSGQMTDVYGSQFNLTENDILSMYRYKTARYTFSLPLALGALFSGTEAQNIKKLETLGENIGLLYQLHDDELNAYGDSDKTGKPVGSDAREHKQTYLSWIEKKKNKVSYPNIIDKYKEDAYAQISELPYDQQTKHIFKELVDFCVSRRV